MVVAVQYNVTAEDSIEIKFVYNTSTEETPILSHKAKLLTILGVSYVMVGISNWLIHYDRIRGKVEERYYAGQFSLVIDLRFWGLVFILAGVVATVAGVRKKVHVGYFALMGVSVWWALLYCLSFILTGFLPIIPFIFIWILVSTVVYQIATWPDFPGDDKLNSRRGNGLE